MSIELRLYLKPEPQMRARTVSKGGKTWSYDPSAAYKQKLATLVMQSLVSVEGNSFPGAVKAHLEFYLKRPQNVKKHVQFHTKRPDLDNLIKAVFDAIQGVPLLFADDSQIVSLTAIKRYATDVDPEGILIKLSSL